MGGKQRKKEDCFIRNLEEGQKYVIDDIEHGSKSFVPIQIDLGTSVEIVQIDGGLITGLPKGHVIADNLIYTIEDTVSNLNITWIIELKGTKNQKEAEHSIDQILESIEYMHNVSDYPQASKYISKRDYVFAAIAGAPDRTLPKLNNDNLKRLCKKLLALSGNKKNIKNMFSLFCYIKPNKRYNKVRINGDAPPYDILCYNSNEGFIPYPSMLMKLLKN